VKTEMTDKRRVVPAVLITAVLLVTVSAAAAFPNPLHLFGAEKAEPTPTAVPARVPPIAAGAPASFAAIARTVKPAVVNVSTTHTVHMQGFPQGVPRPGPFGEQDPFFNFFKHFFGPMPHNYTQRALGSGVIIDPKGYIVTNAHVVKNADKIVIKLENNREFNAKVVGVDEKTDVALLKGTPPAPLTAATMGDSDTLQVGDWVVAIGNPFGLSETVTAGIVSAKGRVIGAGPYDDFIQTDASINPGNSGGPLLDLHGQVVGINSAIYSQSGGNIGIGFAIPINLVKHVVQQLEEHGKVIRGWLGVMIQDVTPELAKSFGLENAEGALVADVTPNSPASEAGFKRGDIILDFNGRHVDESHRLPEIVADTPIGERVHVTVLREGKKETLSVKIAEAPAKTLASEQRKSSDWGLTVADITPEMAQQYDIQVGGGVVVTDVNPDSPAADAGLQPGDVITQVDRHSVSSVAEYRDQLSKVGKKQQLLLLVQRGGQNFFVVLRHLE
jgi:serine protease Do